MSDLRDDLPLQVSFFNPQPAIEALVQQLHEEGLEGADERFSIELLKVYRTYHNPRIIVETTCKVKLLGGYWRPAANRPLRLQILNTSWGAGMQGIDPSWSWITVENSPWQFRVVDVEAVITPMFPRGSRWAWIRVDVALETPANPTPIPHRDPRWL